jgi:quinol-cytochrome oxidoreductase complex cytochrome b subunit
MLNSTIRNSSKIKKYCLVNLNLINNSVNGIKLTFKNRINKKSYIFSFIDSHLIHYPTPINLTYAWSFGSLAGICLVIQILSGILLATHYIPDIRYAFNSIQFIMRDAPNGWLIRYIHANGASMFFIVVYSHICRGLYYGSYIKPRHWIWCSGVVLLLLMMGTAFTGYVLPWGQMSFWGATVITSMVTVIPIAGQYIAEWLWGGYVIREPTIRRFFVVHYLLPFIIAGVTIIHLALLHKEGSNNPLGSDFNGDILPFYPYFAIKDIFAFACFSLFFGFFVFYYPNYLNHPDNLIRADSLKTPAHIVPEWYFLPFYTILRVIPHKTGGILAMFGSIVILLTIPFTNKSKIRNTTFRPIFKLFFWLLVIDFLVLIWVGQQDMGIQIYQKIGVVATFYYFSFFICLPIIGYVETFFLKTLMKK